MGKTTAISALLIYHCLGWHPAYKVDPPPITAFLITHSIEQSRTIQQKLWDMLPKHLLHPSTVFVRGRGFKGVTPLIRFANDSIIRIKTANQGIGLASASLSLCVIDEPVTPDVFSECLARITRGGAAGRSGMLAMSMTPIGIDVTYLKTMIDEGKITSTRAPLTVEATRPKGLAPIMSKAQIERMIQNYLPIDREQRIMGSFDVAPQGVIFDKFDPTTMIIDRYPPAGPLYQYAIGIDHGSQPGTEVAVLAAIDQRTDPQNPKIYMMDEYTSGSGATPEDHARGMLEMVRRNNLRPEVIRWTGDGDHFGSRGNKTAMHMSNLVLMRAFEKVLKIPHRTLRFTVRRAIKKRHSVYISASLIYAIQARGHFYIRPACQRLIQSIQKWTMKRQSSARSVDVHGHHIDAMRYCLLPTLDRVGYNSPQKIRIA